MKLVYADTLTRFNALSSPLLAISFTTDELTMQLLGVVAVSHFKTLASAGRLPGGSFDAVARTLRVRLIEKSKAKPYVLGFLDGGPPSCGYKYDGQMWEIGESDWAEVVALFPADNLARLEKMATTLAKGKAKTYRSTGEAAAARRKARAERRPTASSRRAPEDMDMPMWDPASSEWYDQEIEIRPGGQDRFNGSAR